MEQTFNQKLPTQVAMSSLSLCRIGFNCNSYCLKKINVPELKEEAERHQAQYRSEKQKRKELELRVSNLEEELQDLRTDKDSLEKVSLLEDCLEGVSFLRRQFL